MHLALKSTSVAYRDATNLAGIWSCTKVLYTFKKIKIMMHEKKSQWITKVNAIPPEGGMNVRTRFHGNPSNSCEDSSVIATNATLVVVEWEKI